MSDPKAEALRRYVERLDTAKRGYVSERQSFFDSGGDIAFRAGFEARDEEVASLVLALRQMIDTHGEPCGHHPCKALTNARAALSAADKTP